MAAHDLHVNINQWHSADNDMIAVAKRITLLMAKLSELVRGENGTKKDLIATARKLAEESLEISRIAKLLAQDCTDRRMRTVLKNLNYYIIILLKNCLKYYFVKKNLLKKFNFFLRICCKFQREFLQLVLS
jgi:hypothetical protein